MWLTQQKILETPAAFGPRCLCTGPVKDTTKIKETKRQHYLKNREAIKERSKQYRMENKGLIKERKRRYALQNKEAIREQKKEYNERNKEALKEKKKEYYLRNKDSINERKRQYYVGNKDKLREQNRLYRLRANSEKDRNYSPKKTCAALFFRLTSLLVIPGKIHKRCEIFFKRFNSGYTLPSQPIGTEYRVTRFMMLAVYCPPKFFLNFSAPKPLKF
jgi:hypothetical protein